MRCQIQHLQGSKKGQVEEITAQRITMGRAPDNILAFDPYIDADCSGYHAVLEERLDGFIYAVDLKSTNGTFVNGAPVPPGPEGSVMAPGSMVQLCKAGPALKLDYVPGVNRKAPAPKPPPPPPEPGSNNGLIIGIAIGAVVLVLLIVLIVVLTSGGGAEGAKGTEVGKADGGGAGGATAGAVADAGALEDAGGDAAGGGAGGAAAGGVADATLDGDAQVVIPPVDAAAGGADAVERSWVNDPSLVFPAEKETLPAAGSLGAGREDAAASATPLPEHAVLRIGPSRVPTDDTDRTLTWINDDEVLTVVKAVNGQRLRRFNVTTGQELGTLPGGLTARLGDGERILHTTVYKPAARILDPRTGAVSARIVEPTDCVIFAALSGARVALETEPGWAVFDTETGKPVRVFPRGDQASPFARFVGLSADGAEAAFTRDGKVTFFNVESGAETRHVACDVPYGSWSDRPRIALDLSAVASFEGEKAVVTSLVTGKAVASIPAVRGAGYPIALSPDGKRVAFQTVSGKDEVLAIHDVATGKQVSHMPLDRSIEFLRFSPGGKRLAVRLRSIHGLVFVDVATGKPIAPHTAGGASRAVAVSKDGRRVAAGFDDGTLVVAKSVSGSTWSAKLGDRPVLAAAFADDRGEKVRALLPGGARTWTWEAGEPDAPVSLSATPDAKPLGALSPGGALGAFTTKAGGIAIFDVTSGGAPKLALDKTKEGPRHGKIAAIAISPDGKIVASAGAKAPFRAYDAVAKTEWIKLEKGLTDDGSAIGFSGDGKLFAFAIGEKGYVFDRDKKKRREIVLDVPGPDAIALSSDGALVATEGAAHAILVYDVATGAKVATLAGHKGRVRALAFGGDAKQPLLASGSDDRTALLWSVPPKKR